MTTSSDLVPVLVKLLDENVVLMAPDPELLILAVIFKGEKIFSTSHYRQINNYIIARH